MIKVKDGLKRLVNEIWTLKRKNKSLLKIVFDLRDFCKKEFDKDVTITMIGRTAEEQDFLYRNSQRYAKKKFKSPHQFWTAVDIRSWSFNKDERLQLVNYINMKYNESNYFKWTLKFHTVGSGYHGHLQYVKA